MNFHRSELRNLSPEAQKFLRDYDARQQAQPKQKPIERVEPIHGWKCECGWLFELPERKGAGQCPQCHSIHIQPWTAKDLINAPLSPKEQLGKETVERIKAGTENPQPASPLEADEDFFDREEREAMQSE